ncbi:hypothetical protein RZS08_16010, partial [Arthrospira platensis SPKY1]|nr:hypothetical protein [Arthrospira platensis SPKY1]
MSVHVVFPDIQVAGVQTGAKVHLPVGGQVGIAVVEIGLQALRGLERRCCTVELCQQAVSQAFDEAALMSTDLFTRIGHETAPALDHLGLMGRHQANRLHQIDHQHHLVLLQGKARSQERGFLGCLQSHR